MAHHMASLVLLLSTTFAATLPKSDLPPASNLPADWSYSGCYPDTRYNRVLKHPFYFGKNVTGETCVAYCTSHGYPVAGTEYSQECYCGTNVKEFSPRFGGRPGTTGCYLPCGGNSTQVCGGPDRLSVYTSISTNPGPYGWHSLGCYNDTREARILPHLRIVPGGSDALTVARCTSTCLGLNFPFAGVEFGGECFCGKTLPAGPNAKDGCDIPCKGNGTEFCGGADRLNLYEVNANQTVSVGL